MEKFLSAGSGLSWFADEALEQELTNLLHENEIDREGIRVKREESGF